MDIGSSAYASQRTKVIDLELLFLKVIGFQVYRLTYDQSAY